MKKACIIVDSSSGIINGQYSDVFVVPLILIEKKANNELISYRDDVEIKLEEVYQKLRDNKNISTSQANMQDMVSALEKYSKEYENVFVIPIPKTLSSNVDTWEMIAKEFNNVSVFRQFTLANPLDWMIRHFVEKNVNNELNATYIENYIQQTKNKFCIALIVPDITWLVRGGRVSGFKSIIAKLFNLKLVITMAVDGLIFFDKAKKDNETINRVKLAFDQKIKLNQSKIKRAAILTNRNSDEKFNINELRDLIKTQWSNINYEENDMPATIAAHVGPNYIAVAFEVE